MKLYHTTIILLMGLMSSCLLGCYEKSIVISQQHQTGAHIKEAKPGAAIKLISSSIVSVNANEPTSIEILLDVKELSGTLSVELSSTSELSLLDTKISQRIGFSQAGPIKIPVKLCAIAYGRYHLNIHTSIDNGELLSSRNLALIVQVGPEVEQATQFKKISGEDMISLPAQETISNQ